MQIYFFLGMCVNELLNLVLKYVLKEPRAVFPGVCVCAFARVCWVWARARTVVHGGKEEAVSTAYAVSRAHASFPLASPPLSGEGQRGR